MPAGSPAPLRLNSWVIFLGGGSFGGLGAPHHGDVLVLRVRVSLALCSQVIDDFKENFVKETLKMEPLEVMDERLADKFLPLQDDNESPSDSSDSDSIYGSWDSEDWALGADWTGRPQGKFLGSFVVPPPPPSPLLSPRAA